MAGQRMQLHPCNALDSPFRRITWKATFIYQSCETTKLDCVSSFIPVLIKKSGHSDGLVPRDDPSVSVPRIEGSSAESTASIAVNVVHSELNHDGYWTSWIELRQLLDLAMIRARHESAIDWSDLDHRFSVDGFGHVLATYLKFAEVFFGQAAPRFSNMPRKLALERLRVFVEWPDRAKRRAGYVMLAEETQTLRSQLEVLQQQLASVYSSNSWKITSPLRKARQLVQLPRFVGPRRKARRADHQHPPDRSVPWP
jgi:hypothetical protein